MQFVVRGLPNFFKLSPLLPGFRPRFENFYNCSVTRLPRLKLIFFFICLTSRPSFHPSIHQSIVCISADWSSSQLPQGKSRVADPGQVAGSQFGRIKKKKKKKQPFTITLEFPVCLTSPDGREETREHTKSTHNLQRHFSGHCSCTAELRRHASACLVSITGNSPSHSLLAQSAVLPFR